MREKFQNVCHGLAAATASLLYTLNKDRPKYFAGQKRKSRGFFFFFCLCVQKARQICRACKVKSHFGGFYCRNRALRSCDSLGMSRSGSAIRRLRQHVYFAPCSKVCSFHSAAPADLDLAGRYRNLTLGCTGRNLILLHVPHNKAKQRHPGGKKRKEKHTLRSNIYSGI